MKKTKSIFGGVIIIMICLLFFTIRARADELDAPRLLRLYTQKEAGDSFYTTRITFEATPGNTCYIYRKVIGGTYSRIGKTVADDDVTSYTDKAMPLVGDYIYTVRQRGRGIYDNRLSRYDSDGLCTIRGTASPKARIGNLDARITWKPNPDADGYRIYRRMENGRYTYIGSTTGSDSTTFTDTYERTFSFFDKQQYLIYGCYLDTSSHTVSYTVRATKRSIDFDKISMSPYEKDGYYRLNAPIVIDFDAKSAEKGVITFTSVPYATLYLVQLKYKDADGKNKYYNYASIYRTAEAYIDCEVPIQAGMDYRIKAYAMRNKKTVSANSRTFTLRYRGNSGHNILYIGDSITYGSPYKTDLNRYIFSYPWKVSVLTDCNYYNAAIPGATMAYNSANTASFHRYRIVRDVLPRLTIGTTPYAPKGLLEPNKYTMDHFDTIVILAGTNDYTDLIPVGSLDSDDDSTYSGAYNKLMEQIVKASRKRVKEGKTPTNVVMPDLFYSDRCMSFTRRQSRDRTPNQLGYTLVNYNKAKNNIIKKYRKQGLKIYRFRTKRFVNSKNCPYATADNLHMTKYTYERIGNSLTKYLVDKVWAE